MLLVCPSGRRTWRRVGVRCGCPSTVLLAVLELADVLCPRPLAVVLVAARCPPRLCGPCCWPTYSSLNGRPYTLAAVREGHGALPDLGLAVLALLHRSPRTAPPPSPPRASGRPCSRRRSTRRSPLDLADPLPFSTVQVGHAVFDCANTATIYSSISATGRRARRRPRRGTRHARRRSPRRRRRR